jgi:hypothetical protein
MNDTKHPPEDALAEASREDILAALFANMVIQQTNMAMMMLGKVAHPQTGEFMKDVEAARMFIDQLEMLEAKTKGNLNRQEDGLLKQALAALHMAFVEAVDSPGNEAQPEAPRMETPFRPERPQAEAAHAATPSPAPAAKQPAAPASAETPAAADESRKKFSKKY